MRFLKENSYDILRLFLNQIALAVFGIVLVFASNMAASGSFGVLSLCASIFSILFYLYILYATLQEMGSKHRVKVESGRMERDRFYGLKIMLFAQTPNFLLLFLMLIGFLCAFVFKATTFGINLLSICSFVLYFLQSMYDGLIGYILPLRSSGMMDCLLVLIAYTVSVIPAILVCWGAYNLGLRDMKITSLLHSKKDDTTPKQ